MNNRELKNELKQWFDRTNFDNRNIFNINEVAKLIKQELSKLGKWKNSPRGTNNTVNNLNKAKKTRKELEEKLNELDKLITCSCGAKFERLNNKLVCSNFFCESK